MKIIVPLLFIIWFFFVKSAVVTAHQPRLVTDDTVVKIDNPEISQAFYASLSGQAHQYQITSEREFSLYVSLLVPEITSARTDFTAQIFWLGSDSEPVLLHLLDGSEHAWAPFYEPFAGDSYLEGPELDERVPAGSYMITVSNPDNEGKYVLSVGRQESFSGAEMIETIRRLPAVKRFFDKSPWTAYFNLIGLFMALAFLFTGAVGWLAYRLGMGLLRR